MENLNGEQKLETSHNLEREKLIYNFDIRQKHPLSDEMYSHVAQNPDDFKIRLAEAKNPFLGLEGKNVESNGVKVGTFHVKNVNAFGQCIYTADGKPDCGFFFQIEINVRAGDLDLESATELVKTALENQKIDYLQIQEQVPSDFGVDILDSHVVDTSGL